MVPPPPAVDIRGGLQPAEAAPMRNPIYTIGHSTRPIEEFVELLRINGVERLADIRTIPKSRRNPQYWQDALKERLEADGIDYVYLPGLGGRRRARKDSVNTAWRNASFKGYADHMQTEEFAAALEQLIRFGGEKVTAIMCAEAVPWRCHRSLVARSEEHTSELQSRENLVCRLLLEKKNMIRFYSLSTFSFNFIIIMVRNNHKNCYKCFV